MRNGQGEGPGGGQGDHGAAEWLMGRGEMGELIRSTHWSSTELGPRALWPGPLKTVVSLIVESRFPMAVAWGPGLILLYNDACRVLAGNRHPWSLGRPVREVWGGIWHLLEPVFGAVMGRGETLYFEDRPLPIDRHGQDESAYVTFGCSPLRLDDGTVGGALIILQDTTAAVVRKRLLEESERRFALMHEMAPCGIALVTQPEGKVVSINDSFLRIFELSREEVLGKTDLELGITHPEERASVTEELEKRGSIRNLEVTRRTRSGSVRVLLLSLEQVSIAGKSHVLAAAVDVTGRIRQRQLLESMIAHLPTKTALIRGNDLKIMLVNPACQAVAAGRQLVGLTVEEAWPEAAPTIPERCRRVLTSGESLCFVDEPYPWHQGDTSREVAYFSGSMSRLPWPWPEEDGWGLLAAFWETTDRKLAEKALRRAKEKLQEADRRKDDFLGMLSHELRNPLAPIRNSLYILDHAVPGGDQARRAQAVIGRQVDQLARLVDDLLDATRISQNKIVLQRQQLELNLLVERTVEDHRPTFERAGVHLAFERAPAAIHVSADWNRLAQVVGNLLHNAVKFTPQGGRVTVAVSADAAGQAEIRVVDTGIGMSPKVLAGLFQPFVQAERTLDRSEGGLGLGLALVKTLVELHGGKVRASSAGTEKGSTFTISLPREPPAKGEPMPDASEKAKARRRILVIEDNEDAAESLRELLELEGQEVAVAHSGPEGIAGARATRPDLVLCDIGLPDMDGYAVARAFRADEALRDVPLVALSGYARPEDLRRAGEAGFDRHLAKPASLEKIVELLVAGNLR